MFQAQALQVSDHRHSLSPWYYIACIRCNVKENKNKRTGKIAVSREQPTKTCRHQIGIKIDPYMKIEFPCLDTLRLTGASLTHGQCRKKGRDTAPSKKIVQRKKPNEEKV